MATSASATYFTVPAGTNVFYDVMLQNTSPAPYDIYAFILGAHYNVPLVPPWPLAGIQPIGCPPGWSEYTSETGSILQGQTNFHGSAAASGYIQPGAVRTFVFQSSTIPPPAKLPFGCCFWNGGNEWGFVYNGETVYVPLRLVLPFREAQGPAKLPPEGLGTPPHTMGGEGEGLSVTLTYDEFGNLMKMVHNPPVYRKS